MPALKNFLQGRFMNHPLHPLLVHIPVGLWVASLIFDILFFATGNSGFAVASYYCIALGIIGALLAVPAGLAEYIDIPSKTPAKRIATIHMTMNFFIALLYVINFFGRRAIADGAPPLVTGPLFVLSLISIILLGVSGYFGGLLVYVHGIGHRHPKYRGPGERKDEGRRAA